MSAPRTPVLLALCMMLVGCGGPKISVPTGDPVLRQLLTAGTTAYASRDVARAADSFHAALVRAELTDHAEGIRVAALNLATVHMDQSRWEEARAYLADASAHATSPADMAEIRLLQARVEAGDGDLSRAQEILDEILAESGAGVGSVHDRARLLSAEVALRTGDIPRARAGLDALLPIAPDGGDPSLAARRHRLVAALAENDQAWSAAGEARLHEADAWKSHAEWRAMAGALDRAGDGFLRAGDSARAVEVWLRAARSLAAQDEPARAQEILEKCAAHAGEGTWIQQRVKHLQHQWRPVAGVP